MVRKTRRTKDPWAEAIAHLRGLDARWAELIDRVGPCLLEPRPDRFGTLVRAIIGQQISSRAAASIDAKLLALAGEPHAPGPLLALGETRLRGVGISGVKARYILNLSEAVASGHVPLDAIDDWDDDAIVARLTTVKGIGVWTAEMFLIFALNRPDVLPVGDLGVRVAIRDRHGLAELPGPRLCRELAEPWRPYRSVASWYLWRRTIMEKKFKVGDHVTWNSEAGHVSGKIIKVHTKDVDYKGHTRHASEDDPQYEIKSDKTDHIAMHKGSALKKVGG